jgi:VanZ like family
MTTSKRVETSWIPAALWAASIALTSSGVVTTDQLASGVTQASGHRIGIDGFRIFWGLVWWIFVKGWHATEFAVLFILIRKWIPNVKVAVGLAALASVMDEFHQLFVPHRGCRVSDVLIDWIGISTVLLWSHFKSEASTSPRSKWTLLFVSVGIVSLVFALSLFPFGLVTLSPRSGPLP